VATGAGRTLSTAKGGGGSANGKSEGATGKAAKGEPALAGIATGSQSAPPPPPRKKKKRSGRRR
jgi:hypothetical protein